MKIDHKLLSLYSFIIVTLIVFSVMSFNYSIHFLKTKVTNSFMAVNGQIVENLDTFMRNLSKLTEMPYYDINLQKVMEKDYSKYKNAEYEMIQDYDNITLGFFTKLFLMNDFIDSVYLYQFKSDKAFKRGYNSSYNYDYSPEKEDWYQRIMQQHGKEAVLGVHKDFQSTPNGPNVVSVGRVILRYFTEEPLGVFIINTKPERFEELYKQIQITPNSRQLVVDENNIIIYSNDKNEIAKPLDKDIQKHLVLEGGSSYERLYGNRALIVMNVSKYTSWKVISIIPEKELFKDILFVRGITVYSGIVLALFGVAVALFIARSITKPIKKLDTLMGEVEKGNFDVKIDVRNNDEVGHLSKTFNGMINQIQSLINKNIEKEKQKQQAEFNALQSQINPHFMYNTLNVIKWMAQMQGADNITEALQQYIALLNFCTRTREEYILIKEEIQFLENYVSILRLRYYDRFDVRFDIPEDIQDYKILKFILQPFVENAIFHGLTGDEKDYYVRIQADKIDDSIEFVVIDNGIGIDEETIEKITNGQNQGRNLNSVGIYNVMNRLSLYFGESYKIKIESILEVGTKITVKIPVIA